MAKKDKTLTTRFDSQTWAEFAASVEILGARSINALIHQMVTDKIREARKMVSDKEFEKSVETQKHETNLRSETKSRERLEILGELIPRGKTSVKMLPGAAKIEKKKAG